MRFIAGPRQVGKTTLVKKFLRTRGCGDLYYNWDIAAIRSKYRTDHSFYFADLKNKQRKDPWICFDEIHKVNKWKNILKEHFDQYEAKVRTLITGSARLDLFRRSGDSLAGRYFLFHLLPITLSEMRGQIDFTEVNLTAEEFIESRLARPHTKHEQNHLSALLNFSGFPEPLSKAKSNFHRIWQREYLERIVYEDLRDLSQIRDLEAVAKLIELLPGKIASPLSLNSLKEDLEINHATVKNYLGYLELAYVLFLLKPYSQRLTASIKKEQKVYFYDWTRVDDKAARFENYLASELMSMINLWNDYGCAYAELYFVRNVQGQETDFLIVKDKQPWLLLEAKLDSNNIDNHHFRMAEDLGNIPVVQVNLATEKLRKIKESGYIVPAHRLF
jgi:predicted AAA+ superfamily ATPase